MYFVYKRQHWRNTKKWYAPDIKVWDCKNEFLGFWAALLSDFLTLDTNCCHLLGIFDPTWLVCTHTTHHTLHTTHHTHLFVHTALPYIWPTNSWNGKLEIHSLQICRFLSWNLLKYMKHGSLRALWTKLNESCGNKPTSLELSNLSMKWCFFLTRMDYCKEISDHHSVSVQKVYCQFSFNIVGSDKLIFGLFWEFIVYCVAMQINPE